MPQSLSQSIRQRALERAQTKLQEAQARVQAQERATDSRANLEAMQQQRGELKDQLRDLSRRRAEVVENLSRTGLSEAQARKGLQTQMADIDSRAQRIDQQIRTLDDGISALIGSGVLAQAQRETPKVIEIPQFKFADAAAQTGRSRDFERMMIGGMVTEAVIFALLGVAMWRFGMRRMREQFFHQVAGQTQRMEQIQQSLDVIGVEVERISEGQRFVAKVLKDGAQAVPEERRLG